MQNPAPAPSPVLIEVPVGQTRPLTQAEVGVIRSQRSEMSDQLTSAIRRRDNLLDDIRTAPAGTEEGLKQQLQVLNDRIVSIEKDIEQSGRTLRTGQVPVGTVLVAPRGAIGAGADAQRIAAMGFSFFILLPIAVVILRRGFRRSRRDQQQNSTEQDARMERLEQAVDAIALEIERVGESQRFQGKLLAEANLMPASPVRVPEPVRVRDG